MSFSVGNLIFRRRVGFFHPKFPLYGQSTHVCLVFIKFQMVAMMLPRLRLLCESQEEIRLLTYCDLNQCISPVGSTRPSTKAKNRIVDCHSGSKNRLNLFVLQFYKCEAIKKVKLTPKWKTDYQRVNIHVLFYCKTLTEKLISYLIVRLYLPQ